MLVESSPVVEVGATPDFESYFRRHYVRVYQLLYRVTGSPDDAEDLAQEVFLQAARRDPPLWSDPAADGWLWRAASHAALNALRGDRRRRDREARAYREAGPLRMLGERAEDPAEAAERHAQQAAVRVALRQMKPQESALLLLRHAGLSYAEVADALDLKPSSVGTLILRAERRFKEIYHA
ncbi:MAG: hypothetical protein QOF51_3529 [Chloroflexota bacterium]|jgi:RNA polymerase sigma-70 factor (ECF subfamily)|nr:hypothetical protein [Chloroflexota bacterium]